MGDWIQLIKELASRPTSNHELVAKTVDCYGYCGACNTGAGGVWLPLSSELDPFIWRVQWLPNIVRCLATWDNISISDTECASVLLQQMGLEIKVANLRHKKLVPFCDNMPVVSRVTRMVLKQSRVGCRLVKGLAVGAWRHEMCMPEALSRGGATRFLFTDAELLSHLTLSVPLSFATESLLEGCDPAARGYLQSCLHSAWAEINNGTVDESRRLRYWEHWVKFTNKLRVLPFLEECNRLKQPVVLSAFAVDVRNRDYGQGNQITAQTID